MLKVLVVDDDKLTRLGLVACMPWQEYAMEVVGEAANGQEALCFLQEHPVDLVLTDLEMPLMSGIDLIRQASALYPHLHFVVLTIHSDFEYIQQALRLGAIDYIAKVQMNREDFSALLERISERMRGADRDTALSVENWEKRVCVRDPLDVLLVLEDTTDVSAVFEELGRPFINTGSGVWLCPESLQAGDCTLLEQALGGDWLLLRLSGAVDRKYAEIYHRVMQYRKNALFYDYQPGLRLLERQMKELETEAALISDEEFLRLKQNWLSMNWVRDPAVFDKIRLDLRQSRLTTAKLLHIVIAVEHAWNHSYSATLRQSVNAPPDFHSWQEIEDWLTGVYEKTRLAQGSLRFSPEVTQGILEAKRIIEDACGARLYADDVARRVNMSRSYFSQCFSEIVGCPFGDYLRSVRMEKAKEYLERTSYSIQQIAEMTGYFDEKYFSRIFKKTYHVLPSEYRKFHRRV